MEQTQTKTFLFKDTTGRGIKNKLDLNHILNNWDLEEEDDNGQVLEDFLLESEEGDKWKTQATTLICL